MLYDMEDYIDLYYCKVQFPLVNHTLSYCLIGRTTQPDITNYYIIHLPVSWPFLNLETLTFSYIYHTKNIEDGILFKDELVNHNI